jgi:outer membrane protein OmpA-like peptidoglycan-associated protein
MPDRPDQRPDSSFDADPTSDDKALQELRSLLLSEEQKQILALQERLDNPVRRSEETSAVVAEAIRLRREAGDEGALLHALAPSVEEALRESVRKDSSILADVLFPVMGPAIRKSVAESIRTLIESFNKALESSLSIQGFKWRFEAIRTGRSYAEVALLRSIVYRVEQVLVVHKRTSLLLLHAVGPDVAAKDADMVSGMLSAIQDFVRNSFQSGQGEALDRLQVGELQVWVEHGPHATIAAVIRGEAPQACRLRMREKLEEFHQRFSVALQEFEGDAAPFEPFRPDLDDCLVAHYSKEQKKSRPYFVVLLLVLIGLLAGWQIWGFLQVRRWRAFVDVLREEPGIVVTGMGRHGGRFQIQGLRDPLAINPSMLAKAAGLDTSQVEFEWQAYYSLDDATVLRRARHILRPPRSAIVAVEHGTLHVAGEAPAGWVEQLHLKAPMIPGVIGVDDGNLNNPDALLRSKAAVESAIILFEGGSYELGPHQEPRLAQLLEAVRSLIQNANNAHSKVQIEVVGHSDSTGTEKTKAPLSDVRARQVMQELVQGGIDSRYLIARGVGTAEPVQQEETLSDLQYNRSVTFRVKLASTQR